MGVGENGRASHFPLASGSPVCKQVTSRGKGMRLQQFCFRGVAEKREQELHERQDLDAECEVVGLELPVVQTRARMDWLAGNGQQRYGYD